MPAPRTSNYPILIGSLALVGLIGLYAWIPDKTNPDPEPPAAESSAETPPPTGSSSKTPTAPSNLVLEWDFMDVATPSSTNLSQCIKASGLVGISVIGAPPRIVLLGRRLKGSTELRRRAPNHWTLRTPTAGTHYLSSRLHLAISGCLYRPQAEVRDVHLGRTLREGRWPRPNENGALAIEGLVRFHRTAEDWRTQGLDRMGWSEVRLIPRKDNLPGDKLSLQRIVAARFQAGFAPGEFLVAAVGQVRLEEIVAKGETGPPGKQLLATIVAPATRKPRGLKPAAGARTRSAASPQRKVNPESLRTSTPKAEGSSGTRTPSQVYPRPKRKGTFVPDYRDE